MASHHFNRICLSGVSGRVPSPLSGRALHGGERSILAGSFRAPSGRCHCREPYLSVRVTEQPSPARAGQSFRGLLVELGTRGGTGWAGDGGHGVSRARAGEAKAQRGQPHLAHGGLRRGAVPAWRPPAAKPSPGRPRESHRGHPGRALHLYLPRRAHEQTQKVPTPAHQTGASSSPPLPSAQPAGPETPKWEEGEKRK